MSINPIFNPDRQPGHSVACPCRACRPLPANIDRLVAEAEAMAEAVTPEEHRDLMDRMSVAFARRSIVLLAEGDRERAAMMMRFAAVAAEEAAR
jgi:hypothetical protein